MWASMSWTTYFPQKAIRSFFHPSRHKLQSLSFSPFLRESYWKQGLWKTSALEKYSSRPTTKRSRAKADKVLPRDGTSHSKHLLPTTREDPTHGRHQMVNAKVRLSIFFAAKGEEALYSQQKQDRELTMAQIMNSLSPNSDWNGRK